MVYWQVSMMAPFYFETGFTFKHLGRAKTHERVRSCMFPWS